VAGRPGAHQPESRFTVGRSADQPERDVVQRPHVPTVTRC
jgi:hypothetical protein